MSTASVAAAAVTETSSARPPSGQAWHAGDPTPAPSSNYAGDSPDNRLQGATRTPPADLGREQDDKASTLHICLPLVPSVRTPVSDSVQIDQEAASGAIWDVLAAAVGGSLAGGIGPTEEALRIFLAVAFMVMFTVKANAKFLDGNTLHGWCFSGDVGNQAACLGYVIGVADVLSLRDRV